jgi:hypothetical protein
MSAQPRPDPAEVPAAATGTSRPRLHRANATVDRGDSAARVASTIAFASIGAGAIHAAAARIDGAESGLYLAFFLTVAAAQLLWGAIVLVRAPRWFLALGLAGHLVVLGTWVASRTAGLPVGPAAGAPMPVGFPDAVTAFLEAVIVGGAVWLLIRRADADRSLGRAPVAAAVSVVVVAALVVLAILVELGAVGFLPAAA